MNAVKNTHFAPSRLLLYAVAILMALAMFDRLTSPDIGNDSGRMLAMDAIRQSGYPCGTITHLTRLDDGGIRASCSNGDTFRIGARAGELVAMQCSVPGRNDRAGC